ncbi:MAG: hypothetical protein ACT4NX_07905 [Deltaproteobacteria bacterium]
MKPVLLLTLDRLQNEAGLAPKIVVVFIGLIYETVVRDEAILNTIQTTDAISIAEIIESISRHISYNYGAGVVGTARLPVLAVYSVYNFLISDVKRYSGKILAPLKSHTSPDSRSKSYGDIDILKQDGSLFESIEIKHKKPITADMIDVAYRKIKNTDIDRYYILTTAEPNFGDYLSVQEAIGKFRKHHRCQIIVNGVIPSLKYYTRLIDNPQRILDEYTKWLQSEYTSASGVKREHLKAWHQLHREIKKFAPS